MVSTLASLLFSLFYLSNSKVGEAERFKDYLTAYHAAVSAVKISLKLLQEDKNDFDGKGDDWSKPIFYNYRGISISVKINDECGKFNLNTLNDKAHYNIFKRLLQELNLNEGIADAVKDWIDRDSSPMPEGAEADYYASLGYKPSNDYMKSLGELLYVKGIDEKTYEKLKKYATVYGSGLINVNSAPKEVLLALSPEMSQEAAESIIEARPIKELSKISLLPGMDRELYFEIRPFITNRCNYFKIEVNAFYKEESSKIVAYASRRKVLQWKVVK